MSETTVVPSNPSAITMLEDRSFAFTAFQKAANIFLMSQNYQQCYGDSKYAIDMIIDIENDKYENWESETG